MRYLDTSLVVALVTNEQHTAAALRWLERQKPGEVGISPWVLTECASALSLKQRAGTLDDPARSASDRALERLASDSLTILAVPASAFARAAQMVSVWRLGLRAGDALHLAIAAHHQATICTRDRAQAEAARQVGVKARLLFG